MTNVKCTVFLIFFVTVALLETLLFSFLQNGWSSYVYVLIDNGFYSNLCVQTRKTFNSSEGTNVTIQDNIYNRTLNLSVSEDLVKEIIKESTEACLEQQERLHLLYTISTVIIELLTVGWGPLVLKFGAIGTKIFAMILFMSGCLMLGLSNADIPLLVLPGLILVSLGGLGMFIINMEQNPDFSSSLCLLFNIVTSILPFGKGLFIAILNGACDSSVITFRIVKGIHESGIADLYTFVGLIVIHLVISGTSLILHKKFQTQPTLDKFDDVATTKEDIKKVPTDKELQTRPPTFTTKDESSPTTCMKNEPSLKESLCSVLAVTALCWVSILMLNFFMYLGTINPRLQEAFPDQVSHFTNVLAYVMMCGIVTALIPGTVFEWQSKMFKDRQDDKEKQLLPNVLPLVIGSTLGIILNILPFFESSAVFYTEFVVLTVFGSFLYSSFMSFCVSIYPLKHANVLFPLGLTIGGLFSTVQIVIFNWYNQSESSKLQVKIFMTFLVAVTLIHPIIILIKGKGCFKRNNKKLYNVSLEKF